MATDGAVSGSESEKKKQKGEVYSAEPIVIVNGEKVESDTADKEDAVSINDLLLPGGVMPIDGVSRFSVSYSLALLNGWVKQPSPCCAAAAIAGAWNALMGRHRDGEAAFSHRTVLDILEITLQAQIDIKRQRFERLLGAKLDDLLLKLKLRLETMGKSLSGKNEAATTRALLLKIIRQLTKEHVPYPAPSASTSTSTLTPISALSLGAEEKKVIPPLLASSSSLSSSALSEDGKSGSKRQGNKENNELIEERSNESGKFSNGGKLDTLKPVSPTDVYLRLSELYVVERERKGKDDQGDGKGSKKKKKTKKKQTKAATSTTNKTREDEKKAKSVTALATQQSGTLTDSEMKQNFEGDEECGGGDGGGGNGGGGSGDGGGGDGGDKEEQEKRGNEGGEEHDVYDDDDDDNDDEDEEDDDDDSNGEDYDDDDDEADDEDRESEAEGGSGMSSGGSGGHGGKGVEGKRKIRKRSSSFTGIGRVRSTPPSQRPWPWKKELVELLKRMAGLEKLTAARPSTAAFGNWGIISAVQYLSDSSDEGPVSCHLFMGKSRQRSPVEVKLSVKDGDKEIEAQWSALRSAFNRQATVVLFHLKNHYALVFALREWETTGTTTSVANSAGVSTSVSTISPLPPPPPPSSLSSSSSSSPSLSSSESASASIGSSGGAGVGNCADRQLDPSSSTPTNHQSPTHVLTNNSAFLSPALGGQVSATKKTIVRQLLTARKGQRPSTWIDFEEARKTMLGWEGYKMLLVTKH